MLKRYFLTTLSCFGLIAGYAVSLIPFMLLGSLQQGSHKTLLLFSWAILVLLSLLPILSFIIQKIWFFEGNGHQLPLEELQKTLLSFNAASSPVHIKKKRRKITASWNYQEKFWCIRMQQENITNLYELLLTFHAPTKTVIVKDRLRSLAVLYCPEEIKTGFWTRPALYLGANIQSKKTQALIAHKDKAITSFQPKELKTIILGTILNKGWNIRYSIL